MTLVLLIYSVDNVLIFLILVFIINRPSKAPANANKNIIQVFVSTPALISSIFMR